MIMKLNDKQINKMEDFQRKPETIQTGVVISTRDRSMLEKYFGMNIFILQLLSFERISSNHQGFWNKHLWSALREWFTFWLEDHNSIYQLPWPDNLSFIITVLLVNIQKQYQLTPIKVPLIIRKAVQGGGGGVYIYKQLPQLEYFITSDKRLFLILKDNLLG